jgi:MFS family permease
MHQIVSATVDSSRRWWVLAIVVAAQFMFGVDAFIVNVAIPTIAVELHASPAQIEAVIAIYLIAYATLVITGGRLGDIYGTRNVFLAGVLGFTLTSLWCGLAQTGPELTLARLAQGATAALMVPQVLATLHLLFSDSSRGRAFGIYGMVLGLAGAAGFLLGGVLVTWDLAGLGWRAVFFVNLPFGLIIMAAAWRIMPSVPRRAGTRLDVPGAIVLFTGLLCLIGPLLFGRDLHWAPWIWLAMAGGVAIVAAFPRLERAVASRGGMPLIDLALLSDSAFMRGLCATFLFFFANLSFYLVMTLFMQRGLHIPPLQAGMVFLPLTLTFVIASRHSGTRARRRGTLVLIEGCALQVAGLAVLVLTVASVEAPGALLLALVLAIFGYGQGLVMAPLSSTVLSTVNPASAGSGAGMYGTTTQIANAAGVAAIGAVFFAVEAAGSARLAMFVASALFALSIMISAAFLSWMRRAH